MATTPEGKIKRKVSAYLSSIEGLWYYMPVPGGYGKATLDYLCSYRGVFFSIETKAPGNTPTDRQERCMEEIRISGGATFVIDSPDFPDLRAFIAAVSVARPVGSGQARAGYTGATKPPRPDIAGVSKVRKGK